MSKVDQRGAKADMGEAKVDLGGSTEVTATLVQIKFWRGRTTTTTRPRVDGFWMEEPVVDHQNIGSASDQLGFVQKCRVVVSSGHP